MKIRRFWLTSSVEAHNSASIVLAVPDDVEDKDIPFEQMWEDMGVIWSHLEIDDEGPAELEGAEDFEGEADCTLTRDGQGKLIVQQ